MQNNPSALRGLGLVVAVAAGFSAAVSHFADAGELEQAVGRLSQSSGWRHLDANWIDAVTATVDDSETNSPEMNVDVRVVTSDRQPVAGAVVALQESIHEAHLRVSLLSQPFRPVRGVAVTDADGRCRFDAVPMTPPAAGRYGRIKAYVVIAHPTHGFDFSPLLRTSREQRLEVTIREQVTVPVIVRNASQATEVRITKFDQDSTRVYYSGGFVADAVFCPRAVVNEKATGEFARLPRGQFIGLEVHDQTGWQNACRRSLVPAESKHVVLQLSGPASQLPIRFLDSVTGHPISGVSVDRWIHPEQISDDNGRVVIKPTFPEFAFRFRQVDKLRFAIEPPARWVRENIWEYPHRTGSGTDAFRLTPATMVRGHVVDAKTGGGIAGVVVQSQRSNPARAGGTSEYQAIAVSDQNGAFELAAPPGRQTVSIAAPVDGFLMPAEKRLSVVPGRPVRSLTIKMIPAEPIRGRIVDQDGRAVVGAEVVCHSAARTTRYRRGFPLDSTIASALTDDDGHFAIERPGGQYDSLMIKAFADDRQSRDAVIEFDPNSNRPLEVDLELSLGERPRTVQLTGSVLRDGKPWGGAVVTVDPAASQSREGTTVGFQSNRRGKSQLGETVTDANGQYQLAVNVSDHAVVTVGVRSTHASKWVTLNGSQFEVPPIEVRETPGEKTIKGIVVDPLGLPVAGVEVEAIGQQFIRAGRPRSRESPHRTITNAEGTFVLRELVGGPVQIQVTPTDIPLRHAQYSEVTIPAGESNAQIVFDRSLSRVPEAIEAISTSTRIAPYRRIVSAAAVPHLDASTRISGSVNDRDGRPIHEAIVRVFCIVPGNAEAGNAEAGNAEAGNAEAGNAEAGEYNPLTHPACRLVARTNSQGQFAIGPFPAGARVRIAAGAHGHGASVTKFLSLNEQGATAEIRLTRMDPDLPSMKTSHQLIDEQGAPVPGAIVTTAYSSYADMLEFSSEAGPCVLTDREGNFRFPTAIGIEYKTIGAFPIGGTASVIRNKYSHRKYRLADAMSIEGRIVDERDAPIAGFVVSVAGARLPGVIRVGTAGDGTFRIDDLPCGDDYWMYGASSTEPKRHLLQRTFTSAANRVLDFGDLTTQAGSRLAVKLVPAEGQEIAPGVQVQLGSQRADVAADGNAVFLSLAPQALRLRFSGPVSVDHTVPPLQEVWGVNAYAIDPGNTPVVVVYLK